MRILVIGGTSKGGIGEQIAKVCRVSGHAVDCPSPADLDVTSSDSIHDWIQKNGNSRSWGGVVYSAGVASLQWIRSITAQDVRLGERGGEEEMESVFDVNVLGFIRLMSEISRSQKYGRVLAIVSDAAFIPMRGSMSYCASKAALAMAVKVAAREMGPEWSINGLAPSAVEGTQMTDWIDNTVPAFRGWTSEEAHSYELSRTAKGRRITSGEVAQVAYNVLTGPDFVTGSIIDLSGGRL